MAMFITAESTKYTHTNSLPILEEYIHELEYKPSKVDVVRYILSQSSKPSLIILKRPQNIYNDDNSTGDLTPRL